MIFHQSFGSGVVTTGWSPSATISIGDIITGITVSTPSFVKVRSIISKSSCTHCCIKKAFVSSFW